MLKNSKSYRNKLIKGELNQEAKDRAILCKPTHKIKLYSLLSEGEIQTIKLL